MNRSIFRYLRKKILQQSVITTESEDSFNIYKIECLGFVESVKYPIEFGNRKLHEGILIDKLVEKPEFMKKLEQVENREDNLKNLLD